MSGVVSMAVGGSGNSVTSLSQNPQVTTGQAVRSPVWTVPGLASNQQVTSTSGSPLLSVPEIPAVGQVVTIPMNSPEIQLSGMEAVMTSANGGQQHHQSVQQQHQSVHQQHQSVQQQHQSVHQQHQSVQQQHQSVHQQHQSVQQQHQSVQQRSGPVLGSQSATGNRMVVAKPLHPNQTLPSSILTNLVSMATPSSVNSLSQLASHIPKLTPQMILAGLSSLQQQQQRQQQQQQQQQQILSQQVLAQQALLQMLPGGVVPSSLISTNSTDDDRGIAAIAGVRPGSKIPRAKPIMPKQQLATLQPRGTLGTLNLPPNALSTQNFLTQSVPQKIVAPVAIPPANTYTPQPAPITPAEPSPSSSTNSLPRQTITTNKPRKPCNCKNSQCLKLYCDCFANGEFCRETCNCHGCKNNMNYAEDRAKAVKLCLDRNPHAFKPKVGQNKTGDKRRHIKGCNCKRSGCLKNYCECYEAKIPCSANCRCIGCKNVQEKPENKSLMQLANAADIRTQQQQAATSHFLEQLEMTSAKPQPRTVNGNRLPFSFINKEVARATCLCLLEEASHASMNGKSSIEVERAVLEEFGRCMTQIINSTQSANEEGAAYA